MGCLLTHNSTCAFASMELYRSIAKMGRKASAKGSLALYGDAISGVSAYTAARAGESIALECFCVYLALDHLPFGPVLLCDYMQQCRRGYPAWGTADFLHALPL